MLSRFLPAIVLLLSAAMSGQATLTVNPASGNAPLTVTFTAVCPNCLVFTWNFGDGGIAPTKNLVQTHTYADPGTYTTVFAGADKNGLPLIAQATVVVNTGEDNRYCDNSGTWTGGISDGPAALPKACFNTAIANTPAPGPTVTVDPGKLQAAYNQAACGTILKLAHGQTWNGPLAFPSKNCDDKHWIWIMSDGALPNPGVRIKQSDQPQTARFYFKQGVQSWGDHIRFIGIEWAKQPGIIIFFFESTQGANKIIFYRNLVHGNPKEEAQHGIQVNTGKYIAVIDSSLYEFHCIAKTGTCVDSQAISGGTGATGTLVSQSGPVKVVNNYIEASTENILFGGAVADGVGPNDVEIRRNWMNKPMSWNPMDPSYIGTPYIVKDCFELKNGSRILFEGNVCENTWGGYTQKGAMILLTPKNQAGANGANFCPNCAVNDITLRYNYITTAANALVVGSGISGNGGWSMGQHRTSIHDIVADNLQYATCNMCGSAINELGSGYDSTNPPPPASVLSDLLIDHITLINVGNLAGRPPNGSVSVLLNMGSIPPNNPTHTPLASNISFQNSIVPTMTNGFSSTGGGTGNCMNTSPKPATPSRTWPWCYIGNSPFTANVLVGYPGKQTDWPTGNQFAADFTTMFVNFNGGKGGDYHLVPNSPYAGKGADIDKINAAIEGVRQ